MERDYAELASLVEAADIAIGVVYDPGQPDSTGMLVIKGMALIESSFQNRNVLKSTLTCIRCDNYEEAEALRRVCGDKQESGATSSSRCRQA